MQIIGKLNSLQWRTQDLPWGGGAGADLLIDQFFFRKLHENEVLAERGECVSCDPRSANWTNIASNVDSVSFPLFMCSRFVKC